MVTIVTMPASEGADGDIEDGVATTMVSRWSYEFPMPASEDADGDIEYGVATTVTKSQPR